jgi:hypothetical protein
MATAWKDEICQRQAVSAIYSYAVQAPRKVSSLLDEIIATATDGIAKLTAIKNAATACKAEAAAPHQNGAAHGNDTPSPPPTGTRLAAIQSLERAYQRLYEGLNVSKLSNAVTPLGCQQELEHPGGGDAGVIPQEEGRRRLS